MALSGQMRCGNAVVLLILGLFRVTGADDASALEEARQLALAVPTMPPRPNTLPTCSDPLSKKAGYEPVCPAGYFRCCATCMGATCFSEEGLSLSWRGVRECVRCEPGDFCNGCDTYQRCRKSDVPGRRGAKVSPKGSVRPQDCEICPAGYEADLHRVRCVKKWNHVCNADYISRCVRNCKAEEASRMKNLNFCELMKCQLYCAKRWSDPCAKAFTHECLYRMDGPSAYDMYSASEEWLVGCDVNCDFALPAAHLNIVALLFCAMLAMVVLN